MSGRLGKSISRPLAISRISLIFYLPLLEMRAELEGKGCSAICEQYHTVETTMPPGRHGNLTHLFSQRFPGAKFFLLVIGRNFFHVLSES